MSNAEMILKDAKQFDESIYIELMWPRLEGHVKSFIIGLSDVRAADDIRVSYDFDRDGWKIEQASKFSWNADDPIRDPDWQEVGFVRAWSRKT